MKKYNIGQVIYLLSNKNHKIVPAQIESVTTYEKIDGTYVCHTLNVPGYEGNPELESLDVTVYEDSQHVRNAKLDILKSMLNSEMETVDALANELVTPPAKETIPDLDVTEQETVHHVQLENGMKARVHIPEFS